MDIRYFEFIERLKRKHDDEISCLRGEMDNHTRFLTDGLGLNPSVAHQRCSYIGPCGKISCPWNLIAIWPIGFEYLRPIERN